MFSFICVWINGWVSNREAGDLRRYRAHYDVTVMTEYHLCNISWCIFNNVFVFVNESKAFQFNSSEYHVLILISKCLWKCNVINIFHATIQSPGRRRAIIWTNAGILLIWTWETNFSEILSESHTIAFRKMHLKMSSAKWRQFYLGLNVVTFLAPVRYFRSPSFHNCAANMEVHNNFRPSAGILLTTKLEMFISTLLWPWFRIQFR